MRGSHAKPFILQITMSRAEDAEKRHKLTLALTPATGFNSRLHGHPPGPITDGANWETTDARNDRSRCGYSSGRAIQGLFHSARTIRPRPSRPVSQRYVLAVFRPAAPGRPC